MNDNKQNISAIFKKLSQKNQQHLLSYALFLQQTDKNKKEKKIEKKQLFSTTPIVIEGAENENIFAALTRLKKSYNMIDVDKIFNGLSQIVSEHILQGTNKKESIKKLNKLFAEEYKKQKKEVI
jgi:hypothetical protein